MKRITVAVYIGLVVLLAVATVVEQLRGTGFVEQQVYHTWWFCALLALFGAGVLVAIVGRRLWKRVPLLLLHASFLVILLGAAFTFFGGKSGYLHLEEGETARSFVDGEDMRRLDLPFALRLDSFRVAYYPGTDAPADFRSYVTLEQEGNVSRVCISMNRILSVEGYRFYQSSYDDDGKGSVLSVVNDPWGIGLTYAGYWLLGLSLLALLVWRGGEFRRLLRHPLLRRGGMLVLLFLPGGWLQPARSAGITPVPLSDADSLKQTQVIYHDRVVPFNTLALDFLKKLTGRTAWGGYTAEQVVLGWMRHPEEWQFVPLIQVKDRELRKRLNLKDSHARLVDLFDGEHYKLQGLWDGGVGNGREKTRLDKAILDVDEKVGLILMLRGGTLFRPLPDDGSIAPLSRSKVRAELFYNSIPFSRLLFMVNLTLGVLAFSLLLYAGVRRHRDGAALAGSCRMALAERLLSVLLFVSCLFHTVGYGLRWYIGGRIPLSNGYETMLFLAWVILLIACLLRRRFPFMVAFGFLLSGFTLLVAYLGEMNPHITPLMPVLASPLLSLHVSLIMMAYALFAFMMLGGVLALCRRESGEMLMLLSRLLLYPALFLLGIGIVLGAVWANQSWGRYWAWDPKEVWALITFMVYGLAFHSQSLGWFRRPCIFHGYMVAAFLVVLMTYLGVNYLMGGMHSYANS